MPDDGTRERHVNARLLIVGAVWLALLAAGVAAGLRIEAVVAGLLASVDPDRVLFATALALALFVTLSALPFVPGAEIGFALLLMFGAGIAPAVWLGMICALTAAWAAGWALSPAALSAGLERLGLSRAAERVAALARLEAADRLDLLVRVAPRGWGPALLRRRFPALALVLNLPGNSVLGGGGGIAFVAGASGLFPLRLFLPTVVLATAPAPVAFLVSDALRAAAG